VTNARDVRTAVADLLYLLQDMEIGQRGFLLSRDARYLEPYEEARRQVPGALDRIKQLAGAARAAVLARLAALTDDKVKELADTIALQKAGRSEEALEVVTTNRGKAYMDELRAILLDLIADSEALVRLRLDEMRSTTSALNGVAVAAGLLIVAATGAAGWTVARYTQELVAAQSRVEQANASLEERVKQRTSDLSQANEEIQRFAYIVSHDLRAPLVNILGFTSEMETALKVLQRYVGRPEDAPPEPGALAEARLAADTDMPEALGFIRTSTAKMDKLINAILKLSRQGRRELNPERIDLSALIEASSASVHHQLAEAGGAFVLQGPLPTITSDRLALEQIFGNLIDNAIKYSAPARPTRIEVSGVERRGWVTIKVADNGRGIARQDYDRIFDLFRRAGVQDKPGEGIGLAHVRALVRRLGGEISVESEPDKGSTFTVMLPKHYTPPTA
jgi:signal transduction histidine kinase